MIRLCRIGEAGLEVPVADDDGTTYDLRPLTADIDGAFLEADGIARTRAAIADRWLPRFEICDGARIGAPIARPSAVVCVGQNYAAHAAESGSAPPRFPMVFFKHPNTVVGPFDDVVSPDGATRLDWEVELGVVIGRRLGRARDPQEALAAVAGYVVSHDVSERAWQLDESGGQWSKGKTAPTFNPLGPYLVPADEVDPTRLRLWSRVNGSPRQHSSTSDMVFSVGEILHDLGHYMVLEPGDVVNTGTPEGVALSGRFPYLQVGDVVELGIEHLGEQRQTVVAEPAPERAASALVAPGVGR